MKQKLGYVISAFCVAAALSAQADQTKANNTTALNVGTSWVSGTAPGTSDIAIWDSTVTAANSSALGGNLSVLGLKVTSPGGAITIANTVGATLTIGASGIDMSAATVNLTIANSITVGAIQDWNVASGLTLTVASTGSTLALNNALSLTGAGITYIGASGATTLTGSANLNINNGRLAWGTQTSSSISGYSGQFVLNSGGRLSINTSNTLPAMTINGGTIGSFNTTGRTNTGALTVGGNFTVGGSEVAGTVGNISTGAILFSSTTDLGGATRTITSLATGIITNNGAGAIFSGIVSNGGITKEGSGYVTLTNNSNSFTGAVTINTGNLAFSSKALANASSVTLANSGAWLVLGENGTGITHDIKNLSGVSGSIIRTDFSISGTSTTRILKITQTVDGTFAGQILHNAARPISLLKSGTASLTLSGSTSDYQGGTTLSQGTLVAAHSNALGTGGTVTINDTDTGSNNTTLLLGSVTMARPITVANQGSGITTLGADGAVALPTFSGAITLAKDVTLDGSTNTDRLTFSGGIGGTGNVTIAGTKRVVFATTVNTYSGTTTVSASSILQLGTGGAEATNLIPDASVVNLNGGSYLKLAKGANSETIGGLIGSGTVRGHEGVASIASALVINNSGDYTFSGILENGGASGATLSLAKSGSGKQTLSGANTYTGGTTLSAGVINLGISQNGTISGPLGASGTITLDGGTLQYSASNQYDYSSRFSTAASQKYNVDTNGQNVTWATALESSGGTLTKTGSGTLTLSNSNTYAGATTINGGVLNVTGSLAADSTVSVASDATLKGTGTVSGSVAVSGGGIITGGDGTNGKLTLGSLTFGGAGTVNIGNFANYSSTEAIAAGTLAANGATGSITINIVGANIGAGAYNLMSYTGGSIAGTGFSAFALGTQPTWGPRASSANLTDTGSMLQYVVTGDNPRWDGSAGKAWDTSTSNLNWKLITAGTDTYFIEGDVVLFDDNAAATEVDIAADVSPGAVTFNNSTKDYTLTGMAGIAGTAALLKQGSGTLAISSANSYNGGTTLNAGTLAVTDAGSLGNSSGLLTFSGNSTLKLAGTFSSGRNYTISSDVTATLDTNGFNLTHTGVISGLAGAFAKGGSGTLMLTGVNTYGGATTISAGTLQIGDGTTDGSITSSSGITNNGTLAFNLVGAGNYGMVISGTGNLVKSGAGTLTLSAANSYAGGTTMNGGTLKIGVTDALPNGYGITMTGAELVGFGTGTQTITPSSISVSGTTNRIGRDTSLVIAGTGGITASGTTLYMCGTHTYSGMTTISGSGYLEVSLAALSIANSVLNVTSTDSRAVDIWAGNLTVRGLTGTGNIVSNGGRSLVINTPTAESYAFNGVLADRTYGTATLTLSKQGEGTQELKGTNTYTGGTTISAGTLITSNASALGTGAVTLTSGTLQLGSALEIRSLANASGNTSAVLDLNGQTLTLGNATAGNYNAVYYGKISGAGTIRLRGGTYTIMNSDGSAGTTGNAEFYVPVTAVMPNGVFALDTGTSGNSKDFGYANDSGDTLTLSSLTGYGAIRGDWGGSGIVTRKIVVDQAGDTTFNGAVVAHRSSAGVARQIEIEKQGVGQLTLAGFIGKQTVSAGTGAAAVNLIANGGLLDVTNPANTTTTNTDAIRLGTVTITSGTLGFANQALVNTAGSAGATSILMNGGTLRWDTGNAQDITAGGRLTLVSGKTAIFDTNGNDVTLATALGGGVINASMTKTGSGTLTLSGANNYTGATTVNAGTLELGGGSAMSDVGAVTLANTLGVTLKLSGSETIGSLSGGGATGGNVDLQSYTLTMGDVNTTSYAGSIGGTGGLTKQGSGKLTLSGTSTYTGNTTVSGGTLEVNGSIASSLVTTVQGGGELRGTGTVGGLYITDNGIVAPGNSIGSLGAGEVYFDATSTLYYELDTTPAGFNGDLLHASGGLTIVEGAKLTLAEAPAGVLAVGSKLTLISYNGTWNGVFAYNDAPLTDGAIFTLNSNTWQMDYNDTTGGSNFTADQIGATSFVTLTVIPEPGTLGVLGVCFAISFLKRKRG